MSPHAYFLHQISTVTGHLQLLSLSIEFSTRMFVANFICSRAWQLCVHCALSGGIWDQKMLLELKLVKLSMT